MMVAHQFSLLPLLRRNRTSIQSHSRSAHLEALPRFPERYLKAPPTQRTVQRCKGLYRNHNMDAGGDLTCGTKAAFTEDFLDENAVDHRRPGAGWADERECVAQVDLRDR